MKRIILSFFVFFLLIPFYSIPQDNFPNWAKGIVWYQIFPERFANGDESNDPTAEKVFINWKEAPEDWHIQKWTSNWFAQSGWEKKLGGSVRDHMYERRYGGDIQGIIDHLDYLKELGIGAIYLNPVFEAVSLHKYDGSTYHHIDVNFGPDPEGDKKLIENEIPEDPDTWVFTSADSLFLKLIEEAHSRNIRVIIDGVFNHVGKQFWAFKDLEERQENSKYKDWFMVKKFDDPSTPENEFDYKGWWDIKSLPQFNRTEDDLSSGPKQYIFHSTKRWMDPDNNGDPSDGIDGWRLDVARDVPLGFWKSWSPLVKSINPEAIIIGELWELSPDFVSHGGAFDALMNYSFAFAVNDFFIADTSRIIVSEFINRLKEIDKTYPDENLDILQNLLDSHDTDRLASMIVNPDRKFDRDANEGNIDYNPGKPTVEDYEKQKLIATFQLMYKGAPMIYYGDEVGMWGADDPHVRKPMVWDNFEYDNEVISGNSGFKTGMGNYKVEQNKDLLNYYKKIIGIRNNNPAIKYGDLNFLYSNDEKESFVFERTAGDNWIIAAFNNGESTDSIEISIDYDKASYKELLNGEEGNISGSEGVNAKLTIEIPAGSARIYKIYQSQ